MSNVVRSEEALNDYLAEMDRVVVEHLKGEHPKDIARRLDMPLSRVGKLIKEWKGMVSNNEAIRARALDALAQTDAHYTKLIKSLYGVLEDAEQQDVFSARLGAIKQIADMEARRIELLQKAGALEDTEMGKKIAETERKQAILVNVLREVVGPCKHCAPIVQQKLKEVTESGIVAA